MLNVEGILSPFGNLKWARAAVDKLLSDAKYIPIVSVEKYMDVQFERDYRCNVDYIKLDISERRLDINLQLLK